MSKVALFVRLHSNVQYSMSLPEQQELRFQFTLGFASGPEKNKHDLAVLFVQSLGRSPLLADILPNACSPQAIFTLQSVRCAMHRSPSLVLAGRRLLANRLFDFCLLSLPFLQPRKICFGRDTFLVQLAAPVVPLTARPHTLRSDASQDFCLLHLPCRRSVQGCVV